MLHNRLWALPLGPLSVLVVSSTGNHKTLLFGLLVIDKDILGIAGNWSTIDLRNLIAVPSSLCEEAMVVCIGNTPTQEMLLLARPSLIATSGRGSRDEQDG